MAWWGQNNPKNKGGYAKKQQPARKETQQSKPMEAGWLPAYDASGPKDGGGGSTSSSSSTLDPQLLVVLKQLAEANPAAAGTINELLPDQDHMEIKEQQKKINVLRRLQQRIHKKEAQIKTKEQQMETFMEQVKVHVTKEKQRHKDEIEELRKDIEQARTDILKIKNGGNLETGNNAEMELEEILDTSATSKETEELKRRLIQAEQEKVQATTMMYNMQKKLDQFMEQYAHAGAHAPPHLPTPTEEEMQNLEDAQFAAMCQTQFPIDRVRLIPMK